MAVCQRCGALSSEHERCPACEAWLCPDREDEGHYRGCEASP